MGAVLPARAVSAGLSITVDVDGAAGLPGGGAGYEHRLSRWSERTYGLTRGLERILAALDEFEVSATFYVPGITAERHRDEVAALAVTRHEIGHHGYAHRPPDELDPSAQRDDVLAGCQARSRPSPARSRRAIARPPGSSPAARSRCSPRSASRSTRA